MSNVYILFAGLIILGLIAEFLKDSRHRPVKRKKVKKAKRSQPVRQMKKRNDGEILKSKIDDLTGDDFERLMEMYYQYKGYSVQRVGGSGDHEVDLILSGGKEGYKIAVQCKRWKQSVGNDIVLRLKAGKQIYGCIDAWIVTTSDFTAKAKEAAEKFNIRLIPGLSTRMMINDFKNKKT